jgi:Protein of unknown function (DUF4230)
MAKKRSSGFGTTLVLALVIVVLSAALGAALSNFDLLGRIPVVGPFLFEEQPARTTTGPVVVEGIRDLNQLTTVRWRETVIITREESGTELERIFSGEEVTVLAAGDVESGVNLADLGRDDVQVEGETVTIRLPEPEVLSVSLDEDETRVYDRDLGLLNIRPDDELAERARDVAVDKIEAAARDEEILAQAEQNAENSISAFVTSLGFEEVEFVN